MNERFQLEQKVPCINAEASYHFFKGEKKEWQRWIRKRIGENTKELEGTQIVYVYVVYDV